MHKHILVTGGAGYIGSACVDALIRAGHAVTVFDNFSTGQRGKVHPDATIIEGDITDIAHVRTAVASAPFDTVMHFAAKKAVGESEADPASYFHTNVTGSLNLLTAMSEASIPQLIFSSTAVVYRTPDTQSPFTEAHDTQPENIYGHTKLMVETAIREFARTGKLTNYTIFRYFNVAGDAGLNYQETTSPNLFPVIARYAQTDSPISVFGSDYDTPDGTCVRDYVHLADIATAHLKALTVNTSDTYNLGTGTGYSVRQVIDAFNKELPAPLTVIEALRRAGDPAFLVADATKAREKLGWEPTKTLEDMVKSTLS